MGRKFFGVGKCKRGYDILLRDLGRGASTSDESSTKGPSRCLSNPFSHLFRFRQFWHSVPVAPAVAVAVALVRKLERVPEGPCPAEALLEGAVSVAPTPEVRIQVEPAQVEPAQVEPAQVEPVRVEPVRVEPVRVELAQVELAQVEPVQVEPARVEPVQVELARVEPVQVEPVRVARAA